ncbi:MAG: zinc ribbon domain-containing protein [Gemmatimonadales bacterium]
MTDLERFFRRLVDNLIAIDPARLHRPVPIGEIIETIVPYRTNRRALGLASNEDYDMLVLRLCAGEGKFVRTDPADIQEAFATEAGSPNPDLRILEQLGGTSLILATDRLAFALGPDPETAFAPPEHETADNQARDDADSLDSVRWTRATIEPVAMEDPPAGGIAESPPPRTPGRCPFCGGSLPTRRDIKFCPHCGESQSSIKCPGCDSEVELGWQFCVTCGHPIEQ